MTGSLSNAGSSRFLVADVRFVGGTYHGRSGRERRGDAKRRRAHGVVPHELEWPPSPNRLVSAAVAGVGMREGASVPVSKHPGLAVLADLGPPVILARPSSGIAVSFTQVAGPDNTTFEHRRIGVLKGTTRALLDEDETVTYGFRVAADTGSVDEAAQALMGIVALGRPMDDVVVHAYAADVLPDPGGRVVYSPDPHGRLVMPVTTATALADMERRQAAILRTVGPDGRTVFRDVQVRAAEVAYSVNGDVGLRGRVFVLRDGDGKMVAVPTGQASVLVTAVRDALLAGCGVKPESLHELEIKGVGAGQADLAARIGIVPFPSVGHTYADRHIRRVAVTMGRTSTLRLDQVDDALDGATVVVGSACMTLDRASSLDVAHGKLPDGVTRAMLSRSRSWKSVTPVVLPGTLSRRRGPTGGEEEAAWRRAATGLVSKAVDHAGLDAGKVRSVLVRRHHARAEVPSHLRRYDLADVEIDFHEPMKGPLVLGPGRFLGLGVMAPFGEVAALEKLVLRVSTAVPFPMCVEFAETVRRTVLGLAGSVFGSRKIPSSISGHDGRRAHRDGGRHESLHVYPDPTTARRDEAVDAFVVELPRSLFVEPDEQDRRAGDLFVKAHALRDLLREITRFRSFGREGIGVTVEVPDRLFDEAARRPTRTFRTVTPFRPPAGSADPESVRQAVLAQLKERGILVPDGVEIRGTVGLEGFGTRAKKTATAGAAYHVSLAFERGVSGPFHLGADAHFGGGLFVPE